QLFGCDPRGRSRRLLSRGPRRRHFSLARRPRCAFGGRISGRQSVRAAVGATMRQDPLSFLGDELASLRSQGLYRSLRVLDREQGARTVVDGREVVNLSSNNYLGL